MAGVYMSTLPLRAPCRLELACRAADPAEAHALLDAGARPQAAAFRGACALRAAMDAYTTCRSPETRRLVVRLLDAGANADLAWPACIHQAPLLVLSTPLACAIRLADLHGDAACLDAVLRNGALLDVMFVLGGRAPAEKLCMTPGSLLAVGAERARRAWWGALRRAWVAAVVGCR